MRVARQLESLGHEVSEASPDYDEDMFHQANIVYWCGFLAAGVLGTAQLNGRKPSPETLEATTLACYEYGMSLKLVDLEMADAFANIVCRSVAPFFNAYDVLLTPTLGQRTVALGHIDANDSSLDARGWYDRLFNHAAYTALYNMTGQPAISLPLAIDREGMPLGMQFVARFGAEDLLLRLAGQLEQALPWADRHPAIHVAKA